MHGTAAVAGDLTDSKTAAGAGLQQELEWADYRRMVTNLTAASASSEAASVEDEDAGSGAGSPQQQQRRPAPPLNPLWSLKESQVLDVRGNHDAFNLAVRGGADDYWPSHAAEGRRSGPRARVFVHAVPSEEEAAAEAAAAAALEAAPAGANAVLAAAQAAVRRMLGLLPAETARLAVGVAAAARVPRKPAQPPGSPEEGSGSSGGAEEDAGEGAAPSHCPTAWLLGIDASPDPGLRSPTNCEPCVWAGCGRRGEP